MFLDENLLINEANYFSNVSEIDKIVEDMKLIREKILNNTSYNPTGSKESLDIEKNLATLFNFQSVDINWVVSANANAYTYSISSIVPLTKSDLTLVKDSKGFHFKKKKGKNIFITIYTGLVTLGDFNERELTSVLLHEIGHNFYLTYFGAAITPFFYLIEFIEKVISVMSLDPNQISQLYQFITTMIVYCTKPGRTLKHALSEFDRKKLSGFFTNLGNIKSSIMSFIVDGISTFLTLLMSPIMIVSNLSNMFTVMPAKLLSLLLTDGYRNEKFADNFATMYGFGPEVASAQYKFSKYSNTSSGGKIIRNIPLINTYYGVMFSSLMALSSLGDPHPTSITRINDQKRFLEDALNSNNISPKLKKEILNQIDDINEVYKKYYNLKGTPEGMQIKFLDIKKSIGLSEDDWKELIFKTEDYDYDKIFSDKLV